MHLGVFVLGTGNQVDGWRAEGADPTNYDIQTLARIATTAERAAMDFVFVPDNVSAEVDDHPSMVARLEPMTLLSALAMVTNRIGLVGTASTMFSAPYNLARAFASLDLISVGRAGWNIVTTSSSIAGLNFGTDARLDHDLRYEMADEFVEVVRGLWNTWEDGAVLADKASGRYFDPTRIHILNHKGKYYSVRGPLNAPRGPQGNPVLVQAGSSPAGMGFAARHADLIVTVQHAISEGRDFYDKVRAMARDNGRDPDHCKILNGIFTVVGKTEEEAHAKLARLAEFVDVRSSMRTVSDRLGHDLSQYPLDGPVPDLQLTDGMQGFARVLLPLARRENYTLRQFFNMMAVGRGYIVAVGTPDKIADLMQQWVDGDAADGFVIMPAYFPHFLDDFAEMVVPELQRRGVFRDRYEGITLRDHLGLPRVARPPGAVGHAESD